MNVLIVENEKPASDKLRSLLNKVDQSIQILGVLETVEDTINWWQNNPVPDLIFLDIQLDDGLCFEIFESVNIEVPIIFTTAYDEYTLKAFKLNSVDYLLKPINTQELNHALNKYKNVFQKKIPKTIDLEHIFRSYSNPYKSRFLVKIGTRYKSIIVQEINYFHISERNTFINTKHDRDYAIDYSLERIQKILDPDIFFRINRNCIVNVKGILEIRTYSSSRLQIIMENTSDDERFVVSREKAAEFKSWIDR